MSMKDVPSLRPTRAYSRPVSGSVHPQLSLVRTPRERTPARRIELGMKDSNSTSSQSKGPTMPSVQRRSSPEQRGEGVGGCDEGAGVVPGGVGGGGDPALVEVDRAGLVVHAGRAHRDDVLIRDDEGAEMVLLHRLRLGQLDAARLAGQGAVAAGFVHVHRSDLVAARGGRADPDVATGKGHGRAEAVAALAAGKRQPVVTGDPPGEVGVPGMREHRATAVVGTRRTDQHHFIRSREGPPEVGVGLARRFQDSVLFPTPFTHAEMVDAAGGLPVLRPRRSNGGHRSARRVR